MRRERRDHTLQASALVHEALLRLLERRGLGRRSPTGATSTPRRPRPCGRSWSTMPGGARPASARANRVRVPLDQVLASFDEQGLEVIDLHEALDRLAQAHPRQAQVVTLRFFGGLSVPEVAETLEVSDTTIENDWRFARAWLRGQLGGTPE